MGTIPPQMGVGRHYLIASAEYGFQIIFPFTDFGPHSLQILIVVARHTETEHSEIEGLLVEQFLIVSGSLFVPVRVRQRLLLRHIVL